jgi:hypothetical protein
MFTPGVEALPYIFDQIPHSKRPRVYFRCLAQTIDPDDFVHYTGIVDWMRYYELLVNEFADGILASNEEMVANIRVAGWKAPLYNISGLTFCSQEVIERVPNIPRFNDRPLRVAFTSRLAAEKQPLFFLDIARRYKQLFSKNTEFVILSGVPVEKSSYVIRNVIEAAIDSGIVTVKDKLTKNQYYSELSQCRVLLNTALQDWTSNTASEADCLGCNLLFPAYRSFPEVFRNDYTRLYVPWSIEDAVRKLDDLLLYPHHFIGEIAEHNNGTYGRILNAMYNGEGDRNSSNYRKHVNKRYQ